MHIYINLRVYLEENLTHTSWSNYDIYGNGSYQPWLFFPACDNVVIMNRTYGILESIHYPNPYSDNQRCNWTIQATAGNTVNYTFLAFELESHANCSTDYLEVCFLKLKKSLYFEIKVAKLEVIRLCRTESLNLPYTIHQLHMAFEQAYFIALSLYHLNIRYLIY